VLGADTGDPRRWVGGSLLFLLALFSGALLERLFFLAPCPSASFESGFDELLFLLFFQTLFVKLPISSFSRDRLFQDVATYLVIWYVYERERGLFLKQ